MAEESLDTIDLAEEKDIEQARKDAWMISFADLLSLLLTFFILIYASTHSGKETWQQVTTSITNRFTNVPSGGYIRLMDLDYLHDIIVNDFNHNKELDKLSIKRHKNLLLISISEEGLFIPGSNKLSDEGINIISALGGNLANINNKIEISSISVTNDLTTPKDNLASNLETSVNKAMTIAEEIQKNGYLYYIDTYGLPTFNDIFYNDNSHFTEKKFIKFIEIVIRDSYTDSLINTQDAGHE